MTHLTFNIVLHLSRPHDPRLGPLPEPHPGRRPHHPRNTDLDLTSPSILRGSHTRKPIPASVQLVAGRIRRL